jgi:lysophospholipid acyltransferase (LPLAT)-like uncharacterized protein
MIPMPFSKVVFCYGESIRVPRDVDDAELERYRMMVEDALALASRRAHEALTEDAIWKA